MELAVQASLQESQAGDGRAHASTSGDGHVYASGDGPSADPLPIQYPEGVPPGFTRIWAPSSSGKDVCSYRQKTDGANGERRPKISSRLKAWRIYWEAHGIPPPTAPSAAAPTAADVPFTAAVDPPPAAPADPTPAAPADPPPAASVDPPPAAAPAAAPAVPVSGDSASHGEATLDRLKVLFAAGRISERVYEKKQEEVLARMVDI